MLGCTGVGGRVQLPYPDIGAMLFLSVLSERSLLAHLYIDPSLRSQSLKEYRGTVVYSLTPLGAAWCTLGKRCQVLRLALCPLLLATCCSVPHGSVLSSSKIFYFISVLIDLLSLYTLD